MIDFTYFGVREIRDVVKTWGHLLRAGFLPDSPAVNLLTWIRDRYILRVGLGDYVSQMLDKAATVSVRYCMLVSEDGQVLAGSGVERPDQAVQHFVRANYGINDLPYQVEIEVGQDMHEVRYL
jgi:hypothetical protein